MLMQTTGKHFVMDEKFCLGDLLALGLHNYVDACRWGTCGAHAWQLQSLKGVSAAAVRMLFLHGDKTLEHHVDGGPANVPCCPASAVR